MLSGKKVLVTGGAGFIGSHIVHKLVEYGADVTVLDNLYSGKMSNLEGVIDRIRFIEGDICDSAALDQALEGIEMISHQAARRSVPESVANPLIYNEVNVNGTLGLFIKARDKGIKRIGVASSSSVYGDIDLFPQSEEKLPAPISPYAASKANVEHYSTVFCAMYGMEIVNFRYFNVYGPRQSLDDEYAVVVPKFIVSLLRGESPPIFGDGEQSRDFVYVENVADVNIKALTADASRIAGQVFNVGQGRANTVNNLFRTIKELTGADVEPAYMPQRKGDVRKTHADISRIKNILGWEPEIDFRQGIKRTVEWFREFIFS